MKYKQFFIIFFCFSTTIAQTINLNESHIIDYIRTSQITGNLSSDYSFTLYPFKIKKDDLNLDSLSFNYEEYSRTILNFFS